MKLIGLYSPYPQMGKNTFAGELERLQPDTKTLSFAYAIRETAVTLVAEFFEGGEREVWEWLSDERKDHKLIPTLNVSLRHLLRTAGTEWGRRLIHPDIWVLRAQKALQRQHNRPLVIFDDMRFENEYAMLRKEGGVLIRIERRGVKPAKSHESDARLEAHEFDYHVSNDGDVEELQAKALLVAQSEGII